MDYSKGSHEDMTLEQTKNLAYWERNMLALFLANCYPVSSGWYKEFSYPGWSRVISIMNGIITFHIPDDFDIGDLREIQPNWDGHSTEEKWKTVGRICGIKQKEGNLMDVFRKEYKPLSDANKQRIGAIKHAAQELYDLIGDGTREMALARTKLEESVMWATKSITT